MTSLLLASLLAVNAAEPNPPTATPSIPYKKFVLNNGLTLIIHEDHKAPIVTVNIWYHVGSKNEKLGKTGFAHLFEHLMFNGSEHFDDDYFKAMEKVGATGLNGTTSEDRTNYFEDVPRDALDFALWMESDRMGHLLKAITQAKLDEQRGVVQNEKRQGENRPYAIASQLVTQNTWPVGHPYSWEVIGSMEDLNAAKLEDVHEWFKTYYGAANATLVVAGDVTVDEALAKVKKYFGHIPSGPPVSKHQAWIAKRSGTHRMKAQDRVPQARIYKIWNTPQYGTVENTMLRLASSVLSSGKTSRLYKRLVYDEQIATDVSAYADGSEIAGQFHITATAKPGMGLEKIEKAIDEELAKFLKDGPTEAELKRIKAMLEGSFIRGMERIGGFGGKSDILAQNEVFLGNPDYYQTAIQEIRQATVESVMSTARAWLSDGQFVLEIHPFPKFTETSTTVDRSKLPVPDLKPEARFPEIKRTTLSNGLKVVFAERKTIPIVQMNLIFDAGYAADQFALPGTANLAMDMLKEGTQKRSSLQINDELESLSAYLSTSCNVDASGVSLNALKANLDASLELFTDVVLHPSFPETDFARLKKQRLASIQREKVEPNAMARRVFPGLIFGKNHAYGNPSNGTEESVSKLTTADMRKYHQSFFKPNNATMVVVGDITLEELKGKLEQLFQEWKPGDLPEKKVSSVALPEKARLFLIDKPGAPQSIILGGHIMPPMNSQDELAIETMNFVFGGTFTSRINMNLREDKHWSYGVASGVLKARHQRPFMISAPVQGDKTKDALLELDKELRKMAGDQTISEAEFAKAIKDRTLRLGGTWETMSAVLGSLAEMVFFKYPDNHFHTYTARLLALKQENVANIAREILHPDQMTWIVVGDRSKIEASLRELNWGTLQMLDADGNAITQ